MANKGGFLGNLYYSITGEDNLKKILQEDKALAQEVAKIAGGIKIGKTRITQKEAEDILKVGNAYQGAAKGADQLAAARERALKKQSAGEFKEYIRSLTSYSDAQKQMSAYYRELEKEMGTAQTAAGSIKMLEAELKKLKDTYRSLSETDRNSILGKTMLTQINNADENLAKINAEMANNAALAKTMGTQYNGLRTQINMVARELPNLGISLSTFIISLSNNIAYLADEISKAIKQFNELKKNNQEAIPVWKQIAGAIFNWQTALIVGVTVLTAYSREIQAWIKGLIEGTGAAAELSKTQKILNDLHDNATKNVAKETAQLQLLYGVTQDATRTIQERTAAAEQLQMLFPDYFGNLNTETILVGNAQRAYELLAVSIEDAAKASILQDRYADLKGGMVDAINDRNKAQAKLIELNEKLKEQTSNPFSINYEEVAAIRSAIALYTQKLNEANEAINMINKSYQELQDSYNPKAIPQLDIIFKDMPEVIDFNKTIADLNRSLSLSEITQDEYNKKVNDAKGTLIAAADAAKIGGSAVEQLRDEYIAFNKVELSKKSLKITDKESQEIYKNQQEYLKASKALEDAILQSERDIEQAQISSLKEGGEKQIAQLEFNYKKRKDYIKKKTDDLVKVVRDQEFSDWKVKNPNKKESEFTSKVVDYKTLPSEFKSIIDEMMKVENDLYKKSIKDYFDSVAKEFQGYIDKRVAIEKKFAEKRNTLEKSGVSKSTLKELDYQENKALEDIDLEFAQREKTFKVWTEQITKLTIDDLRRLLLEAETELIKLERFSPDNDEALARTRAEIAALREQLNNLNLKPNQGKDAIKDWQKLYKTLNEVDRSFQEIGDTVGGTVGEIIKAAGTITSSTLQMINGIVNLANWSTTATKMAAEGATESMIAIEKASVILTIVSAALKAVTAIAGLFKKTDYMEKFREETRKLNYELSLLKLNAQIDKNKDNIFGEDLWINAKNNINTASDALERYNTALDNITGRKKYTGLIGLIAEANGIKNSYDSAAESIGDMQLQIQHSTWFRSAKYESLKDAVPELFNEDGSVDMDALEKFLGSDTFKKLSAENQQYLQEMADYWKTYQNAVDNVKNYLSDIFGDFGSTLSDALVDAFENGSDAAKAFTKSVSDMLENLAAQMAYSIFIGPELEKAQKEVKDIMLDPALSDAEKFEKAGEIVDKATANIMEDQDDYNAWLEARKEEAKKNGYDIFEPDNKKQSGLSGAIQGVTEDTADLLGSYMNAMRADLSAQRVDVHTMANIINANLPAMSIMAEAQLRQLNAIANNTLVIAGNTGKNSDTTDKILNILEGARRSKDFGLWIK